jgi:hypothetical protein
MTNFSVIHIDQCLQDVTAHPAYHAGHALGWLYRGNKSAATNHALAGRLYLAKSGWLLLSVPNALVRGVYDALDVAGAELPRAGTMNVPNVDADVLNAHISVMNADEVQQIGENNINERGRMFGYSLGALKEITPRNVEGISKIWVIQVVSPELAAFRKSYGLSPLMNDDHPFHITVAVRRKHVLGNNSVSKGVSDTAEEQAVSSRGELKAASVAEKQQPNTLSRSGQKDLLPGGEADNLPDREFSTKDLAEGALHEHEHTRNDQIAKEIAKDHLHEDPAYYEKVKMIEKDAMPEIVRRVTKSAASVYVNQALNALNTRQPIRYDHNKPVFQNIQNQLAEMKRRGDFIMQSRRNHEMYMSALSPQYRHQRMMQAFHGQLPQQNLFDTVVENYGDQILGQFQRPQ